MRVVYEFSYITFVIKFNVYFVRFLTAILIKNYYYTVAILNTKELLICNITVQIKTHLKQDSMIRRYKKKYPIWKRKLIENDYSKRFLKAQEDHLTDYHVTRIRSE